MNNPPILNSKSYEEESIFHPENLLREARRQKKIPECDVPPVCVLDPDGDVVRYLKRTKGAEANPCWACYHSELYNTKLNGQTLGIIPCAVGAPYAVLVAEQLFVSGCELLISVTSAGVINESAVSKQFALITEAIRDEGASYHYLPPEQPARIPDHLLERLSPEPSYGETPFFQALSWTTDAPYRETRSAVDTFKKRKVTCVEMEAAALYAFAEVRKRDVLCLAHLTNSMAQEEGDFEKGEDFGSLDTLDLISYLLDRLTP